MVCFGVVVKKKVILLSEIRTHLLGGLALCLVPLDDQQVLEIDGMSEGFYPAVILDSLSQFRATFSTRAFPPSHEYKLPFFQKSARIILIIFF